MLERVALHQTRLRVPGVTTDGRGVALGPRGLVLLPTLERLVVFLAVYSRQRPLETLAGAARSGGGELSVEVLASQLRHREIAVSFDAASSDHMDGVAEVARISGGFTFTGAGRHFVQYRDATAPFGYDAPELSPAPGDRVLHHSTFQQSYGVERALQLPDLLRRLMLQPDESSAPAPGSDVPPLWILADPAPGAALVAYLGRHGVAGEVAIVELPPATDFDDGPLLRHLLHVPRLPPRMLSLVRTTPGLTPFTSPTAGVAVELGHRHPVTLAGCPGFDPGGLVLFHAGGRGVVELDRVPALAPLATLLKPRFGAEPARRARGSTTPLDIAVPLRIVTRRQVGGIASATVVAPEEAPLLRRLAYALPRSTAQQLRVAATKAGLFLITGAREESLIPLGVYHRSLCPGLHIPMGLDFRPAVAPELLRRALGANDDIEVFVRADGSAVGIPRARFVPLDGALLEGHNWAPLHAAPLEGAIDRPLPVVWLEPLGLIPLGGARALPSTAPALPPASPNDDGGT